MILQTENEVAIELINELKADSTLINTATKTKYTVNLPSGKLLLAKEDFCDMSLDSRLIDALHNMGYEKPSAIQAIAIPSILSGIDVAIQSESGTGKTISFVLPALNIVSDTKKPQVIVITPTKGLNIQVGEIFQQLGSALNINCFVVKDQELLECKCEIIVGSPGGLMNMLRKSLYDPNNIRMVIIDEADACLDLFSSQIIRIMKHFEKAKKVYFSATYSPTCKRMISKFSPTVVELYQTNKKPEKIRLFHLEVKKNDKISSLLEFYEYLSIGQLIIFTNTKVMAKKILEEFLLDKHMVSCIHGEMDIKEREENVQKFRNAEVKILIATDVFSRGMDIAQVNLIVNFDMPVFRGETVLETYIHRVGRSGRFGREGFVIDFISEKADYDALLDVQAKLNCVSKKLSIQALRDAYHEIMK